MFCTAAFIVLVIMSIFSATQRKLLKKAWGCVARRVTLRPCNSNFKEEVKNKLLTKVALKRPRLVKAADIGLEVGAFLILFVTFWSLFVVVKSGLNLFVYGTCNPSNSASCSLGAEACSIESAKPSFVTSVKTFKVHSWVANEAKDFAKTVSNVPTRLQKWDAGTYAPKNATYLQKYDSSKPTALEIFDPGCKYCKEMYTRLKQANFAAHYNFTYIAYPIPSSTEKSGYKFSNSYTITQYLEAVRLTPLQNTNTPADWQLLDRIFTWQDAEKVDYQIRFNAYYSKDQAIAQIHTWLSDMGYTSNQLAARYTLASSQQVKDTIAANRATVEKQIKTVKNPTSIFDGRRHDGVVNAEALQR